MKQKLLKIAIALVLSVTTFLTVDAQKTMDVSAFTSLDNDLMARVTKPVRDNDEGKLCALIRVITSITELEVRADALGIVQQEKHNNEIWLYVPYGARSLSFAHQGYFPLLYQYALPINEGTVYELHLVSFDSSNEAVAQNTNTQLFVLTHQPDEASVFIDGVEVPTEYGVFAAMMSKGDHTYKVTANQYEDVEGSFTLGDQTVRESAILNPLFGTFQLNTLPDNGFNISVNGKKVGVSPYKSEQLDPGNYQVHVDKDKYYPVDTLVRLREGDNQLLTIRLTSREDSLFYNRIMGGRNVSFGVSASYLFPFVSSSAGGGYTGSPINYALGDSRENTKYFSQSGFSVGILADIRLYKNLFLTTGVNYTQVMYKNDFNEPIYNICTNADDSYVYIGDIDPNFVEKYTFKSIEIPILASYRFVLTRNASVHLNFGPYFNYGLSAKMKVSGSADAVGNIYSRQGLIISSSPVKGYGDNTHMDANFDLYSKEFDFVSAHVFEGASNTNTSEKYIMDSSPYKRFNYGLRAGIAFELRGFQIGINYSFQLSNMGNNKFWESSRIPILNGQTGVNSMSGYRHKIHTFDFKLAYVFRY